jgi:hypothetical protein
MVGDRHVEQGGFCNEPEFSLSTVCEYRTVASAWSLGGRAKEEQEVCDRTRLLWTVHAQNTITTRIERIDGRI